MLYRSMAGIVLAISGVILLVMWTTEVEVRPLSGTVAGSFASNVAPKLATSPTFVSMTPPARVSAEDTALEIFHNHARMDFRRSLTVTTTLSDSELQAQIARLTPPAHEQTDSTLSPTTSQALGEAECARLASSWASRCLVMGVKLRPGRQQGIQQLRIDVAFQESSAAGQSGAESTEKFKLSRQSFQMDAVSNIDDIKSNFYRDAEGRCEAIRQKGSCSLLALELTIDRIPNLGFTAKGNIKAGKFDPADP